MITVSCKNLRNPWMLLFLRSISTIETVKSSPNQHSFVVKYLVDSCGFSSESALSASKLVNFETPIKPDRVLEFFKNLNFSETQIRNIIKKIPALLVSDPEKSLLPKIQFFDSRGVERIDVARILVSYPWILRCSVKKRLVPSFDYFYSILRSNEKMIAAIRFWPGILYHNLEKQIKPAIGILRESGVSDRYIRFLVCYHPRTLVMGLERFMKVVDRVKEMGFDSSKSAFVVAVIVINSISKSTWEKKVNAYRKWGLSKEDIFVGFAKYPPCMQYSEEKIMAVMNLFVNGLGWEASLIIQRPYIFTYSMEKRLIPRASVLQFLVARKLLNKEFRNTGFFTFPEKRFFERFVYCHADGPAILELYRKKMKIGEQSCNTNNAGSNDCK